jgi:nicotinamidase-related amidase
MNQQESGEKAALLVVDVQHQPLSELSSVERRTEFLTTIGSLVARARALGVPVVYVRHQDDWVRPGSDDWQIAGEVAPRDDEPIVEKRFRDAFRETDLEDVLRRLDIRRIIVFRRVCPTLRTA